MVFLGRTTRSLPCSPHRGGTGVTYADHILSLFRNYTLATYYDQDFKPRKAARAFPLQSMSSFADNLEIGGLITTMFYLPTKHITWVCMWKDRDDCTVNSNFWALYSAAMTPSMPTYAIVIVIRHAVGAMEEAIRSGDYDPKKHDAYWLGVHTRMTVQQDKMDLAMIQATEFMQSIRRLEWLIAFITKYWRSTTMTICQKRDEMCKCWCENVGRSLLKPEAREWNDDFNFINSMRFRSYECLVSCSACSDRDMAQALGVFYRFSRPVLHSHADARLLEASMHKHGWLCRNPGCKRGPSTCIMNNDDPIMWFGIPVDQNVR